MQSVPITTDVVSSNLDQGEVYNITLIKCVSDLRQVGDFLQFSTNKTDCHNIPIVSLKTSHFA
jgi:hypothetical protein